MTIREIAAQAGVTKGTVSKVLNNKPGVGNETRQKVLAIVKRTGFKPSSAARALALQRTETLGLIVPRESGPSLNGAYWSSFVSTAAMDAGSFGYRIMLLTAEQKDGEEELIRDIVSHKRVDGLIIGLPGFTSASLSSLAEQGFPFVTIGQRPGWEDWGVDTDNTSGARDITSYMVEKGFRRIAMICGPESMKHMRDRVSGFRDALNDARLLPSAIKNCAFSQESVSSAIQDVFGGSSPPEALFVGSGGEFLLWTLKALADFGVDRHDLGLAVFDDYPYLEFTDPGITAVRQPIKEMAHRALEIVTAKIAGSSIPAGPNLFATTIVPRSSCRERSPSL